jgi:hypothetical protein
MTKSKRTDQVFEFILRIIVFGGFAYFERFKYTSENRLLLSFLFGLSVALLITLVKWVIKPWTDKWKVNIKRSKAERNKIQDRF